MIKPIIDEDGIIIKANIIEQMVLQLLIPMDTNFGL